MKCPYQFLKNILLFIIIYIFVIHFFKVSFCIINLKRLLNIIQKCIMWPKKMKVFYIKEYGQFFWARVWLSQHSGLKPRLTWTKPPKKSFWVSLVDLQALKSAKYVNKLIFDKKNQCSHSLYLIKGGLNVIKNCIMWPQK